MNDVLKEQQVDRHFVLRFAGDVRDPGEESLLICGRVELVTEVRKVKLERWIGHDELELLQPGAFVRLMIGLKDCVALNHVLD